MTLDYPVFDGDTHYYEPPELFEQYIDPRYRDATFRVERTADGELVTFDGRPYGWIGGSGFTRRLRPGSLLKMLRQRGEASDEAEQPAGDDEDDERYAVDPAARLELMDRQGIEATLVFPSTGVTIENTMREDLPRLNAHVDAFNRWLLDCWSFNYKSRIFAPPVISLADPEHAVRQLEFAQEHGARAIQMMPGPAAWGRSPADPLYDPFWARVNEAEILVAYHIGNSGYMERYSPDWGEDPDPDGIHGEGSGRSAFQWAMYYRDRPIMETLAALICHNLFGRFPNVRVISVENSSRWVPYLLGSLDFFKAQGRSGPWPNGYVSGRLSEVFRRHVYVSPHHRGDDVEGLVELIGASQVVFGSDFPHPEGMSDVGDYREQCGLFASGMVVSDDDTRKVMRDNGLRLVGLA